MGERIQQILVTGGTGKTGRRVGRLLAERGLTVRMGSRFGQPRFDWEDPTTWEAALRGADAAYLTYAPDLAVPGAAEAIEQLSRIAVDSGVRRLVLLSGRGEPEAQRSELKLQQSGIPEWTVVRASWFMQNFDEGVLLDAVRSGQVALPVQDVPEPFIDADDIAEVVTAALTEDRHAGQVYEVTGPRLLTFTDALAEIAQAAGRPVRLQRVSLTEYAALLAQHQVPKDVVDLLCELFTVVLDGRNAYLGDGVQRALGRQPRDFSDYARRVAATGIWAG